jgi:hypothetical protein
MLKKILLVALLVGFTGVLVWGGVNRTLAKSGEGYIKSQTSGNGIGNHGQNPQVENQDIVGPENEDHGSHGNPLGKQGQTQSTLDGFGQATSAGTGQGNLTQQSGGVGKGNGNGNQGGQGNANGGGQGNGTQPLDENEIQALHLALDDEYHALAVYQSVIATYGEVDPFVEIAQAEQRHIDALVNQFVKHNLQVPENPWLGEVAPFDSLQAACQAGVEAEIANADLYEQLISMTDDSGLIQVFNNLSQASLNNHLPQFQACQ